MLFSREIPVKKSVDICIVGGGAAGVTAAVAAARAGAKVYLAEALGMFGGLGTAGGVPVYMTFTDGINFCADGLGREIKDRMNAEFNLCSGGRGINPEKLKRIYDDMCSEAGVDFSFFTDFIGAESNGRNVTHAIFSSKSGIFAIEAKVFIDCSGDAELTTRAGGEYMYGNEKGEVMPGTVCSHWANIDWQKLRNSGVSVYQQLLKAFDDHIFRNNDPHHTGISQTANTLGGGNMGHIFGLVFDFLYGVTVGAHLWFLTRMPSPKIIAESFAVIRPRVIACVPLIVEKIFKKNILPQVDNKLGKLLLHIPIVSDKIKEQIRRQAMEVFGGNFIEIVIGGAPFNAEVEAFLRKINFPYTIAYGMTECAPLICHSRWDEIQYTSCGKTVSNMETKVDSPDPENVPGELLCRGMNVMLGYFKNQEATEQTIDKNGWLHTGDMAVKDAEGNIFIKGRCKNMLLTASGQNIYPEEIEARLNNMPFVNESLVILKDNKLVALVYPDNEEAFTQNLTKQQLEEAIETNRVELNKLLPAYSQIAHVKLYPEEFEKTAKKSIKRFLYQ